MKSQRSFLGWAAGTAALLSLLSCASINLPLTERESQQIAAAGGNAALVNAMLKAPHNDDIDSLLLFKNGELLVERYGNGYDRDKPHDLRSSTKAITALLLGVALDQGLVASVEQPILDYFPEQAKAHPEFGAIRIRDLLTMTSGLDSDDWNPKSPGNEEVMYTQKSWVDFFFGLKPIAKPGERFSYSTAGVIVLGELIARASGMRLDKFADLSLFQKLGITEYAYALTPASEVDAGGHLKLKPSDFAKIGLLVLQRGFWIGTRVVSEAWIQKINEPANLIPGASPSGPYMGYLWWQEPVVGGEVRSFQTRGNGGQFLIAVPSEDLLGVFTGSSFNSNKQLQPFLLMKDFVIPAFR